MRRREWLSTTASVAGWLATGWTASRLGGCGAGLRGGRAATEAPSPLLARYRERAERLRVGLGASPHTRRFLDETWHLPPRAPRTVVVDGETHTIDEETYYVGGGGEPLAYTRLLELAEGAGASFAPGSRWLDFGFGAPGQLQMLGRMGLDVVGLDVDPVAAATYVDPSDVDVSPGTLALTFGRWPGEEQVRDIVGTGFDCFMSKNTLKRGYIRPAREAAPARLIDLGVEPAEFLARARAVMREGARFVIWNLGPAQTTPPDAYIPWADCESPFTEDEWARAGFELVAYSVDDAPRARDLARALDYDEPDEDGDAWDIERNLTASYTIAIAR